MKARLVESHRERVARIERGEQKVIGQNSFTETEDSPLTAGADGGILTPDPEVERERVEALERWKAERDEAAVAAALDELARVAGDESAERDAGDDRGRQGRARPPASGRRSCARPSAPTAPRPASTGRRPPADREQLAEIRGRVDEVSDADRPPDQDPGRQAGPRRPLQRLRADRPARPRRRHGGHLPGDPPDPGARSPSRRCRRTSTWSASRSSPAPTSS